MTLKTEQDDDEDLEIEVIDDEDEDQPQGKDESGAADADDDEDDDDEDEGEGKDAKAESEDGSDPDEEARREERRRLRAERRKTNRERKRQAEAAERARLSEMERRLEEANRHIEAMNARALQQDAAQVDAEIAATARAYNEAKQRRADAILRQDPAELDKAEAIMANASARYQELNGIKQRIAPQLQQVQTQQAQPGQPAQQQGQQPQFKLTPRGQQMLADFSESIKSWYDAEGKDEDSAIVNVIDARLISEGYTPNDSDYYAELKKRLAARLPHRFSSAGRRGPPTGGARANSETRGRITIDRATKEALIDAGYWDDPVKRRKMARIYAAQDRNSR